MTEDDSVVVALQERFPAWWVWVSDTGTWWASRRRGLTSAELAAGHVPYLQARTADELGELLVEQDVNGAEDA